MQTSFKTSKKSTVRNESKNQQKKLTQLKKQNQSMQYTHKCLATPKKTAVAVASRSNRGNDTGKNLRKNKKYKCGQFGTKKKLFNEQNDSKK